MWNALTPHTATGSVDPAHRPRSSSLHSFSQCARTPQIAVILSYVLIGVVRCITLDQAFRAISFRVLLTIAASFGPGAALSNTYVSDVVGYALGKLSVCGNWFFLFAIYLVTAALSSIISNSATVVAMYQVRGAPCARRAAPLS